MVVAAPLESEEVRFTFGGLWVCDEIAYGLGVDAFGLHDLGHGLLSVEEVPVPLAEGPDFSEHQIPGQFHMVQAGHFLHDSLEGVGIGCVADIMQKTCRTDLVAVLLGQGDGIRHLASEMICTETVFETGMVRTGENEIGEAQLLDPSQPLHLVPVEEFEERSVHLDASVDRIVNCLRLGHALTRRLSKACRQRC